MDNTAQADQKFLFFVTGLFSVLLVGMFLFYGIMSFIN
jgi:hypothetical protein